MKLFHKKSAEETPLPKEPQSREDVPNDVSRRQFMTGAVGAAAGAGLLLGQSAVPAWAGSKPAMDTPATPWPATFDVAGTVPQFDPREMPKAGEVVHKFAMEVTIGIHEIVPGIKAHMFLFNGSYPGPTIRVQENEWVEVTLTNKSP